MPLPFILIGAAAAATAIGAKKAYDGHQDKSEADYILKKARVSYEDSKQELDQINNKASESLENLGELELKIGSDFDKFDRLVEEIMQSNNFQKFADTKINIPKYKLNQIKEVAISATDYLKTVVGGGVSGAATGFAVYGGVMALGAASTGTPIAALSGVAAYNATMAAIGGGALTAGGWGMAGGAMVLGGAVIAPILAVGGIAYGLHGAKALKEANKVKQEVNDAVTKITVAKSQLRKVDLYANQITSILEKIYIIFTQYFESLKHMNEIIKKGDEQQILGISNEASLFIQNGMACAAIMAKLISTPLFKVKTNTYGDLIIDSSGLPQIEIDANGMQVLDKQGLDSALKHANNDFQTFKESI